MEIKEFTNKAEMLTSYDLLLEVYPDLTIEDYNIELDTMLPHNYGQIGVFDNGELVGMTGYWIGTKLWCGKYMELDNVVVSKKHRGKGIGKVIFDHMNNKAKEEKCSMLALDTYSDNFEAHKFFYNQGFVPRGFHFINVLDESKIR